MHDPDAVHDGGAAHRQQPVHDVRLVRAPEDPEPPATNPEKRSIIVQISGHDRISIAHRQVDWRAVRANIERLHAEAPEAPVVIQSHPDSSTEALVHVMDQARLVGVDKVTLAAR